MNSIRHKVTQNFHSRLSKEALYCECLLDRRQSKSLITLANIIINSSTCLRVVVASFRISKILYKPVDLLPVESHPKVVESASELSWFFGKIFCYPIFVFLFYKNRNSSSSKKCLELFNKCNWDIGSSLLMVETFNSKAFGSIAKWSLKCVFEYWDC